MSGYALERHLSERVSPKQEKNERKKGTGGRETGGKTLPTRPPQLFIPSAPLQQGSAWKTMCVVTAVTAVSRGHTVSPQMASERARR